jgi:hypothetical protein
MVSNAEAEREEGNGINIQNYVCNCSYSKCATQSYPRRCVYCGKFEK